MKKLSSLLLLTCLGLFLHGQIDTTSIKKYSIKNYISIDTNRNVLDANFQNVESIRDTVYDTIVVIKEVHLSEVSDSDKEEEKKTEETKAIESENEEKEKDKSKKRITPLGEIFSGTKIFWSLIILIGTYFFIRALVIIIERFAEKSTNYRIALKSTSPFVRIIGWIIAIVWIIEGVFALSNQKLFAFLASAGLAIGFASQDILKNIFGGIMILFDRPFQVGDKIEVGAYYGEVKEIGLRSTRILTKDDSLVSVPNAEVVNSAVSNSNTGEANCQVVAEIYLPIDSDTNLARLIATEAAQVSRFIYLNKPITVLFFNEIKEERSYLKMRVKAYVSDIRNEFVFKSDMTEVIIKEFLKQGVFHKKDVQ